MAASASKKKPKTHSRELTGPESQLAWALIGRLDDARDAVAERLGRRGDGTKAYTLAVRSALGRPGELTPIYADGPLDLQKLASRGANRAFRASEPRTTEALLWGCVRAAELDLIGLLRGFAGDHDAVDLFINDRSVCVGWYIDKDAVDVDTVRIGRRRNDGSRPKLVW